MLQTMATTLALKELQQTQNNSNHYNGRVRELKKQIKYFTKEINQQKAMRRSRVFIPIAPSNPQLRI